MTDHYQAIALELNGACPAAYSKAWIDAEVTDTTSDNQYWCVVDGEEVQPAVGAAANVAVSRALISLRREMRMEGKSPWSRCTFTLMPSGEFKLNLTYDD